MAGRKDTQTRKEFEKRTNLEHKLKHGQQHTLPAECQRMVIGSMSYCLAPSYAKCEYKGRSAEQFYKGAFYCCKPLSD